MCICLEFKLGFDSLSYSVDTKNQGDRPVISFLSIPEVYDGSMIFPINVTIAEVDITAVGKSCMDYISVVA